MLLESRSRVDQDSKTTFSPPYGPVSNLKMIFDTWRDRSMPEKVDSEWLERVGLSPNLSPKNLHALRFLGLMDEEGYTTQVAHRLRGAAGEEYPSVLEEIVRKAYRPIFELRNPSQDSRTRLEDAFRNLEPQAQRSRMVACFLGLCSLALIPLKESPPVRETASRTVRPRPATIRNPNERLVADRARIVPRFATLQAQAVPPISSALLDPVLRGLIDKLAEIEDTAELDSWFSVFKSAFAFVKNANQKMKNEAGG